MYEFTDPRLAHPLPKAGRRPRFHTYNFILTIMTAGLWLPVWIIRSYSHVYKDAIRLP